MRVGESVPSDAEEMLLAAATHVNSHERMANNPDIKFRSFVCLGLNARLVCLRTKQQRRTEGPGTRLCVNAMWYLVLHK